MDKYIPVLIEALEICYNWRVTFWRTTLRDKDKRKKVANLYGNINTMNYDENKNEKSEGKINNKVTYCDRINEIYNRR